MQRDTIIQQLKENGCRITKQRMLLLDIILADDFSCCKEIYYKASKTDSRIGAATVYRMINTLEEIGAIDRKNMYRISCDNCASGNICMIELDDDTRVELSACKWEQVIQAGLKACGYIEGRVVKKIQQASYNTGAVSVENS